MSELTARQKRVYDFICEYLLANNRPPSVREIAAELGIRNPHGVLCHLKALAKKGVIEVDRRVARGIVLLPPMAGHAVCPCCRRPMDNGGSRE